MFGFDFGEISHKRDLKILICNEAYIGDLILSSSVLLPLKRALPRCRIGVLTGPWSRTVLEDHCCVDWVHTYEQKCFNRAPISDTNKRRREIRTKKRALEEVKSIGYDIALDLHSYYKESSASFLFATQIPLRVAHWGTINPFFYNRLLFWNCLGVHVVENHKIMLEQLGIDPVHLSSFQPHLEYRTKIDDPEGLPQKYALVHLGTGERSREWELDSWRELLGELDKRGISLVFIGKGVRERGHINALMPTLGDAYNYCDRFSFKELIPIVKKATFLLGVESMAGHLAALCGTRALLIYASESAIDWRPYHPHCQVIMPCAKAWLAREEGAKEPITSIKPQQVLKKLKDFLNV